jgi:hypothetical protein
MIIDLDGPPSAARRSTGSAPLAEWPGAGGPGGEVGGEGADHVVDVNEWLERQPSLLRTFVDNNYRPRHRADSDAG